MVLGPTNVNRPAARAVNLALEGQEVLVLCFNITLAHYLHDLAARHARTVGLGPGLRNITFDYFHGFCGDILDQYGDQRSLSHDDWLDSLVSDVDDIYAMPGCTAPQFDAVLIDEGQDFKLTWWNMLRQRVLRDGGEMLLVSDRTQDVYRHSGWTDEDSMLGAGFRGRWTELKGTYRMPPDLVPVVADFAQRYLSAENLDLPTVESDHPLLLEAYPATVRRWINADEANLAVIATDAVEHMLINHTSLHSDDLVVLADHDRGLLIADELTRRKHVMSHVFSAAPDKERQRRKRRFWGGTPGIKGCTIHSFKGWEARAVVIVLTSGSGGPRNAYVAMTRLKGDPGNRAAFITVVNANPELSTFQPRFERAITSAEVPTLAGQGVLDV